MVEQLYLLFVTVLLLFALALTLPVLRDIVREGLERHQQRKTEKIESDADTGQVGPSDADSSDDSVCQRCPHCGAVNKREYSFCQECAEPL